MDRHVDITDKELGKSIMFALVNMNDSASIQKISSEVARQNNCTASAIKKQVGEALSVGESLGFIEKQGRSYALPQVEIDINSEETESDSEDDDGTNDITSAVSVGNPTDAGRRKRKKRSSSAKKKSTKAPRKRRRSRSKKK